MSRGRPPALPERMTLPALQGYVRGVVEARNFTRELDKVFILLAEEVGELAAEYGHHARDPAAFDPANLCHEITDVLLYLLDLANGFGVELAAVWPSVEGGAPASGRAPGAGEETLNDLARRNRPVSAAPRAAEVGGEMAGEMGMPAALRLCEEVGELAREVRKSWKGLQDRDRAAAGIATALACLFEIGGSLGMDFEAALTAKEKENAARTWSY